MLKSLVIKNFRMLEDFKVDKLGHVNLIVGKNNSGKSSVLEALRIYAGSANLALLQKIAEEHHEKYLPSKANASEADNSQPFEAFFPNRIFPLKDEIFIEIGDLSDDLLKIEHVISSEEKETVKLSSGEIGTIIRQKPIRKNQPINWAEYLPILPSSLIITKGEHRSILRFYPEESAVRSVSGEIAPANFYSFIPTRFLPYEELADEWDKIALTSDHETVKQALKIIAPEVEDIAFVRHAHPSGNPLGRIAKVKLNGYNRPVPLNSLGDGMQRILQLTLKAISARNGFLLIDEFENGLHYSVQEKVWALVFDLAKTLNIQVFATTHSWDCIESFAQIAKDRTDAEGVLFRMGRSVRTSDNGKIIATVFDEDQLFNITQTDVEVR